ncbi:hypothetical protein H1V43_26135 [Streptomyces sp. PSKA54]|uniref:Uncharacterized protein n=1 Tax=Streptomyces himalayensis subsp. aureolus TaxID=2758039 RepID=A0A7W2D4T5_9ACTN|nr:T3SS effector HopA1 family protein [Streptomyces himalayensis]MBA4864768.1 hypothetical protein [Streptomyces himalayensis subsp. aureolus]
MTTTTVDPRVVRVGEQVSVSVPELRADVAGRALEARSRAALQGKVASALYEVFHTGLEPRENGGRHRDPDLEERYAARLPGRRILLAGSLFPDQDGDPVVRVEGVRVRVPAASVVRTEGSSVRFAADTARPNLSPGFFTAFGSRGGIRKAPILRVYVSAGTEAQMLRVWGTALEYLESAGFPYQAKATARRDLMARRDGMVVYLDGGAHSALAGLVEALSSEPWESPVPLLTRRACPGVGYAWEPPRDPSRPQLSFGQHRFRAIAKALFAHGDDPTRSFLEHAREHLLADGIDPDAVHRNIDSPAVPHLLETTQ